MEIIEKSIDELIPYKNNPRKNDEAVDKVAESIKEFGFKIPIVIDKNKIIVAGHTRLKAAKKLGLKKVPCIIADDLTDEQIKAFRLADNKVAEFAQWDEEKLMKELDELGSVDMSLYGFDELENELEGLEAEEDDYDESKIDDVEPRAKPGDIFQLGEHRLICGDSTDAAVIDRLMDGVKADLLITDPPYNVDYEGKTKEGMKIQNDKWNDGEAFRAFLRDAFACANAVMRDGAVFYIWHADLECYNFRGACDDVDWKVRECLIWNKNSLVLGRQDYQWKHEPCLYGWKDGATHVWNSDRKQTTVIDYDRPTKSELHPTMKPVGLFAYEIQNSTHTGDLVLDLFGGSGTSLIACEQLNRKCFMCELDPHYVDVIIDRWETLTGKKAEKIE